MSSNWLGNRTIFVCLAGDITKANDDGTALRYKKITRNVRAHISERGARLRKWAKDLDRYFVPVARQLKVTMYIVSTSRRYIDALVLVCW